MELAKIPDSELCQAYKIIRAIKLYKTKEFQRRARKELQSKLYKCTRFPLPYPYFKKELISLTNSLMRNMKHSLISREFLENQSIWIG